jgi:phosphatidylcholine synthase
MSTAGEPALVLPRRRLSRRWRQALGWAVHLYTALGLVLAAGAAVLIVQGDPRSLSLAFVFLWAAVIVDATDGTLARAVRIKEVLPGFDGRRLDDIIDFLTYAALPLLLLWRSGMLPEGQEAWLLAPLLASAYGFCQVNIKTDDGYFLGFPSCWNLVVFYLYAIHFYVVALPAWLTIALLLTLALLTFVPSRYLYPNKRGRINTITNVLGGVWGVMLITIMYQMTVQPGLETRPAAGMPLDPFGSGKVGWLVLASLFFPVYYLGASWLISWTIWHRQREDRCAAMQREALPAVESHP